MTKIDESIKTIQYEIGLLRIRGDELYNVLGNYIAKCDCGVVGCDLCRMALRVSKEWKGKDKK